VRVAWLQQSCSCYVQFNLSNRNEECIKKVELYKILRSSHSENLGFMWMGQTAINSVYDINWLVSITATVRTESLNMFQVILNLTVVSLGNIS
jgi:RNase P/RNase MRP subunit POP5